MLIQPTKTGILRLRYQEELSEKLATASTEFNAEDKKTAAALVAVSVSRTLAKQEPPLARDANKWLSELRRDDKNKGLLVGVEAIHRASVAAAISAAKGLAQYRQIIASTADPQLTRLVNERIERLEPAP